jgi:mycothiol system anti-sigma-R factor
MTDRHEHQPASGGPELQRDLHHPDLCAEVFAEMYTIVDESSTETRITVLRAHLVECPPCADAVDFHVRLRTVVRQGCRCELPVGLRERILACLDDPEPPS